MKSLLCLLLLSASLIAQSRPSAQPDASLAVPPGAELRRWEKSGMEAKWLTFKKSMAGNPGRMAGWVVFLAGRKEYELLEWIVIYDGWSNSTENGNPGHALQQANSARWIRAAIWSLGTTDGHNQQKVRKALLAEADKVLGWIRKFPDSKRVGASKILPMLGDDAADPGNALPPLDPMSVLLPFLDAPKQLPRLGGKLRAEPRQRYLHQVTRAIDGITAAGQFREPYRSKLLALTRHPDVQLRAHATLAFSKWPALTIPSKPLFERYKKTADVAERQRLLLALSYSDHPRAWLALRAAVLDPKSSVFDVALSRMGDVGGEFAVERLKLIRNDLDSKRRAELMSQLEKIAARKRGRFVGQLPRHIEALAWAVQEKHPLEPVLRSWLKKRTADKKDVELTTALQTISNGHVLGGSLGAEQSNMRFTKRVRALAAELAK